MKKPNRKQQERIPTVVLLLGVGRRNARSRRNLMDLAGMPDRAFRREVERLRREGWPILSDERGYWLAADAEERERWVRRMKATARSITKTANAIAKR